MSNADPYGAPPNPRRRLRLRLRMRQTRRTVLRHRRELAVAAVVVAVLSALRVTSPAPPPRVSMSVLARPVAAGSVIRAADLRTVEVDPRLVPAEVVLDPVGRAVATGVTQGEALTAPRLIGSGLQAGAGRRELAIRLPDPATAALLRIGDTIDLIAVDPQAGAASRVVATGVPVLAVPAALSSGTTGSSAVDGVPGGLVVVLGVQSSEVTAVSEAAVRFFVTWSWSG